MSQTVKFSFELAPPRTPEAMSRLPETIRRLAAVRPEFFSVTFGAGGSTQTGTYDTVMQVIEATGIEAAPHLSCIGSSRARIVEFLERYHAAGVKRIVALRGDLPATAVSSEAPGEFRYANELVEFIRDKFGETFQLEVAAYPEMHPQAPDPQTDLHNFRRKIAAGADGAVTQYFYNADAYFDFVQRCQQFEIDIPIVPGIMPITNFNQLVRFSQACGADLPRWLKLRLEPLQHDKAALLDFGLEVVTRLCETLLRGGAPGLHFYTLNQAEPTLRLWRNLGLPVPAQVSALA